MAHRLIRHQRLLAVWPTFDSARVLHSIVCCRWLGYDPELRIESHASIEKPAPEHKTQLTNRQHFLGDGQCMFDISLLEDRSTGMKRFIGREDLTFDVAKAR
jgi:hypothetical protein